MRLHAAVTTLMMSAVLFGHGAIAQAPALSLEQLTARSSTELAPGLYSYGSFASRGIFVVTDDGVIATDPADKEHAEAMRAAIADVTDQPVKYVIYSHQHWDRNLLPPEFFVQVADDDDRFAHNVALN